MNARELRVGLRVRYSIHPRYGGRITKVLSRGRCVVKWRKTTPTTRDWHERPSRTIKAHYLETTAIDQLAALTRDTS